MKFTNFNLLNNIMLGKIELIRGKINLIKKNFISFLVKTINRRNSRKMAEQMPIQAGTIAGGKY